MLPVCCSCWRRRAQAITHAWIIEVALNLTTQPQAPAVQDDAIRLAQRRALRYQDALQAVTFRH